MNFNRKHIMSVNTKKKIFRKFHEASALCKELQVTEEIGNRRGDPVPNGQP